MLLRAYGQLVQLRGPAAVITEARRLLPPTYRPGRGDPDRTWSVEPCGDECWRAQAAGEVLAESPELSAAGRIALSDLELWVAEHARQRVFVHAGCVAYRGKAILLPGRTFSGKSTLTAALLRAGAEYLSDEYAVIDGAGYVHPYARPLSLRREQGLGAERLSPGAIGAGTCEKRVRVAIVAGLHYDANLEAALEVEQLPADRGLLELLDNTPSARSRPAQTLAALARAVKPAIAIRGLRGEADAAAASVLALL